MCKKLDNEDRKHGPKEIIYRERFWCYKRYEDPGHLSNGKNRMNWRIVIKVELYEKGRRRYYSMNRLKGRQRDKSGRVTGKDRVRDDELEVYNFKKLDSEI